MFCPCHVHYVPGSRCVEDDCSLESGRLEALFHVIWTVLLLWELAWSMRLFHGCTRCKTADLLNSREKKKTKMGIASMGTPQPVAAHDKNGNGTRPSEPGSPSAHIPSRVVPTCRAAPLVNFPLSRPGKGRPALPRALPGQPQADLPANRMDAFLPLSLSQALCRPSAGPVSSSLYRSRLRDLLPAFSPLVAHVRRVGPASVASTNG
jgi:hypothetical protein